MTPEQQARQRIDAMLTAAGWAVQNHGEVNLKAARGVAVREYPLKSGFADYLLLVDGMAVGVLEAKRQGTTLTGVETQSARYTTGLPDFVTPVRLPLPFAYESTGVETYFRDVRDPDYRSRRVFSFHRPETLHEWACQSDTLRARLKRLPPLDTRGLRACQVEAVTGLERSLAGNHPRSLLQMATGSGKTFTAITASYRLIKHADAKRILFLVDRGNLGRQTLREFQQYTAPDDGRKFTELYNVQHLKGPTVHNSSNVVISTIQRLYSVLSGEAEEKPDDYDERSTMELDELQGAQTVEQVAYNPTISPEAFDFIIVDECHRSIYNRWRQVLEYFDAFIIGLTATPSKQTLGFFNRNLVTEYPHERAVADGVNVPYDVYRIRTRIGEEGAEVEAGQEVQIRDKGTREQRWEQLEDALEYDAKELDRSVVSEQHIRTVISTFKEKLKTELYPDREHVPKTLVFAKNDFHAEDIVRITREVFEKGNEFCQKITYRTEANPDDLISAFRNSYNPRIAITVDMISTGTDVKPIEVLLFMRDVKSQVYFEQMVGRGTRVITETELRAVTPDAKRKTHFVLVDAVGVTETNKHTDVRPLERKPYVSFEQLLNRVAYGKRDKDTLTSLAGRLARLGQKLEPGDDKEVQKHADGRGVRELAHLLFNAVDEDKLLEHARKSVTDGEPNEGHIDEASKQFADTAAQPFHSPKLRTTLVNIWRRNEQIIDKESEDAIIYAGYDYEKARQMVTNFKQFIEDNKDELLALQILYNQPYKQRHVTYQAVKELAEALRRPPYYLDVERLWQAYTNLEEANVRGAPTVTLLTNVISLVRYALGKTGRLTPYSEEVNERFSAWLAQQERQRAFTPEQLEWLTMIKDHLATSLAIEPDDFELPPFIQKGGKFTAAKLFGPQLPQLLSELNEALGA